MHSSKIIHALLDEGSTVTIINPKIMNEIGVKKTRFNVSLAGVGS